MTKEVWEIWLENEERKERDFQKYLKNKKIKIETETKDLVQGHLNKADHNLKFVKSTLELKDFNDWAIVSAYYSIYHASLALCALNGYSTKDHLATLLILIRDFYDNGLDKEDIEIVNRLTLKKEEVLYYTESKNQRSKASYSTNVVFDSNEAEDLQKKAINFVNKVKEIIDSISF
ncbi:HEPN domain-containing protein [Candidatus Pacearchaeota archaeon]|nr:HEPN domain-containing protein [Candidatus Pacearchaeota archaeon]